MLLCSAKPGGSRSRAWLFATWLGLIQVLKIFIAGSPRSGTSILYLALTNVLGLPGYGESHVMPLVQKAIYESRKHFQLFKGATEDVLIKQFDLDDFELFIFDYIRRFYFSNFPEGSWVDKTPSDEAVWGLPLIEKIFPEARLIATKRNGIEVVESYIKKFHANFPDACLSWTNRVEGLLIAEGICKNLLIVDQHDFANRSDSVSRAICYHVDAEPAVDRLSEFLRIERTEKSSDFDWSNRRHLIDTKWSGAEKQIFASICGPQMEKLGYKY